MTTDSSAAPGAELRTRIIEAATSVTASTGWSSLTMGGLAELVGVSRQTVHNEIGSRRQLAEEVVFAELQRFLVLIDEAFAARSTDLAGAVRTACREVLVRAAESPLIHAVVSASHGARHDLLPLLTTQSRTLLDTTTAVVQARLAHLAPGVPGARLSLVTDVVVRTVLSHLIQPTGSPDTTADDMAWLAQRLLT